MSRPWIPYVQLGIVHFMVYPEMMGGEGAIAETAAVLLSDGFFEVLEVGPVNEAGERARLREVVKSRHATLAFACQPILLSGKLNLNALGSAERARAVNAVRAAIQHARELGAVGLAVVSGSNPALADRHAATDALADSLVSICREAGSLPVHLEVFDYDVDKKCLIGPTAAAVDLARRVRAHASNFGLMLDLSHLPLQHERSREALTAARDVLTHAHVGNCVLKDPKHPRYGDQHPRFGLEGGENDVPELVEFLSVLFEVGYLKRGPRRMVSIEVKPGPDETSDDLLAHTKRTWEAAWARVRIPA